MNYSTYVRLINTHAKSICSYHYPALVESPCVLLMYFLFVGKPSMEKISRNARFFKCLSYLSRALTTPDIDNARTRNGAEDMDKLFHLVFDCSYHIRQVLACEAHPENIFLLK